MRRASIVSFATMLGLWAVLLAGLWALPDGAGIMPERYVHLGGWTMYQDPMSQLSVYLRDLRPF